MGRVEGFTKEDGRTTVGGDPSALVIRAATITEIAVTCRCGPCSRAKHLLPFPLKHTCAATSCRTMCQMVWPEREMEGDTPTVYAPTALSRRMWPWGCSELHCPFETRSCRSMRLL